MHTEEAEGAEILVAVVGEKFNLDVPPPFFLVWNVKNLVWEEVMNRSQSNNGLLLDSDEVTRSKCNEYFNDT